MDFHHDRVEARVGIEPQIPTFVQALQELAFDETA